MSKDKIKLIGITGKAGAGKDTVASYIHECVSQCYIDSFADPIYKAISVIFNIPISRLKDREVKESCIEEFYNITVRKAMQTLGTEWGRQLDEDLWLTLAKLRYNTHLTKFPNSLTVISDVRFKNEAEWIKTNGILLEINRPIDLSNKLYKHASELGIGIQPDLTINNGSTLEDLKRAVRDIVTLLNLN